MHRPRPDRPAAAPDAGVLRFTLAERWVHHATALLLGVCVLTAGCLYVPALAQLVGRRALVVTLHEWSGLLTPLPFLAGLASHAFRADLRRLNRFGPHDRDWLGAALRRRREGREAGKFNAGQKVWAAWIAGAVLVMTGTGLLMWFTSLAPLVWRTAATFVHDWLALAVGVVVLGHIAMALGDREARRGMRTGRVDPDWARSAHPLWRTAAEPVREPVEEGVRRGPAPHLWVVVLAACAGQFLVVLDVSVVNVALPSMRADLGLGAAGLQWVLNAYTLTFAGFMLLGGRAGDLFGRKRMFLVGLGLFAAASLAGGLAQEGWQLIAARGAQGVGAAVLAPATLTILTTSFPEGPARTRAIGIWTAVGAGGGAAGGLVGGVLTDTLSWRWVLLINVPIGALVLLAAAFRLAESRSGAGRRLDTPGALLVTGGLGAVAYGIVETESAGWTSASALAPLLGGLAVLAVFVAVEARTNAPLMPLQLFRLRSVSSANVAMFVNGAAMFCMWYFMSLYMQNVLGYEPIRAGLGFIPQSLSIVLGSMLAPRLITWMGAKHLAVAGTLVAAGGYFWQTGMHAGGGYATTVLGPGVLMALGAGLSATPLAAVATAGAAARDAGLVSGLINTSRTMGGALGLAALSTVAAARIDGAGPASQAAGYALAFRTGAWMLLGSALLMLLVLPNAAAEPKDKDADLDMDLAESDGEHDLRDRGASRA